MSDSGPGRREVAYRLFAAEFDDADLSYSVSAEERAPNYVVTPTGARANRLFAVGVLTEVDDVNPEMVRGRLVDPTGAFVTYAGQYQPEALAALERADPPGFFALTGKARTYEPEDGDRIYSSVRPESVSEVDGDTRDRWVVTAAERTIERIGVMASAIDAGLTGDQLRAALREAGVDDRLADGVALALDHYGTTPAYLSELREVALDAVRVVAGERDEVDRLELAPGEGAGDAGALATIELSGEQVPETAVDTGDPAMDDDPSGDSDIGGDTALGADSPDSVDDEEPSPEPDPEPETTTEPEAEHAETTETADPESDVGQESTTDTGPDDEPPEEPTTDSNIDSESETVDDGATDASSETDVDPAADPNEDDDPIGDFDDPGDDIGAIEDEPDPEDLDPGEFELDEEERREVEDEFGTEFSTADEIEPADIEPEGAAVENPGEEEPDSDPVDEASDADPDDTSEAKTADEDSDVTEETTAADDEESAPADEADEAVDLEAAVMALMSDLDDGDGVDREALVEAVVDAHGADPEAVDEAIQDALMSGQCYEPADDTLKPI